MKKISMIFAVAFLAVSVFSVSPAYAGGMCNETIMDKAWDWGTTLGKEGLEKDKVLMKNKAERAQRCAEKAAKKAEKEAEKKSAEMKKKLGL